jgi:hypothetical protein
VIIKTIIKQIVMKRELLDLEENSGGNHNGRALIGIGFYS